MEKLIKFQVAKPSQVRVVDKDLVCTISTKIGTTKVKAVVPEERGISVVATKLGAVVGTISIVSVVDKLGNFSSKLPKEEGFHHNQILPKAHLVALVIANLIMLVVWYEADSNGRVVLALVPSPKEGEEIEMAKRVVTVKLNPKVVRSIKVRTIFKLEQRFLKEIEIKA